MKISDKAGLTLIKGSIKHMSKEKMLGLISIVISFEKQNPESSKEILDSINNQWEKRKYDKKELDDYLILCRSD